MRGGRLAQEQIPQQSDGVREIEDAVVVAIAGIKATRFISTTELVIEQEHHIAHIDEIIGVAESTSEQGLVWRRWWSLGERCKGRKG